MATVTYQASDEGEYDCGYRYVVNGGYKGVLYHCCAREEALAEESTDDQEQCIGDQRQGEDSNSNDKGPIVGAIAEASKS